MKTEQGNVPGSCCPDCFEAPCDCHKENEQAWRGTEAVAAMFAKDTGYDRITNSTDRAKEKGLVGVLPCPCELQLDIDDAEGLARFHKNRPVVMGFLPFTYQSAPSPSRASGRFH